MVADWLVVYLEGAPIHIIEGILAALLVVMVWRIWQGHVLTVSEASGQQGSVAVRSATGAVRERSAQSQQGNLPIASKDWEQGTAQNTDTAPVKQYIDELFH